jgi:hypothetical protein
MDFTVSPPALAAEGSLSDVAAQTLLGRLPGPTREFKGVLNCEGSIRSRGLSSDEMADTLTGKFEVKGRELSFGSFDPLGALAELSHWGKLEPVRGPVATALPVLNLEIKNRRVLLSPANVDLNGAILQFQGSYAWSGALDLSLNADLRHVHRSWFQEDEVVRAADSPLEVRLTGKLDHLSPSQPEGLITASKFRGGTTR